MSESIYIYNQWTIWNFQDTPRAFYAVSPAVGRASTLPKFKTTTKPLFLNSLAMNGLPCGSAGKESARNAGDLGSIPGLGRSPREGKGFALHYSGLEHSMDCIVHRVAKSRTRLRAFHFRLWTGKFSLNFSFRFSFFFNFKLHFFFSFYFNFIFKLYNIVLVVPNIEMNPPQVYICSPSWTLLPPHTILLGRPSAPAPSIQYHALNLDWLIISYMIVYMFQCHSPKSPHPLPLPLPQSPEDWSIHQCLFCCLVHRVIVTIFLNSIYMR